MQNRNTKGFFVNEYGIIYVQGSVNGTFYRKSTKKKATKENLAYVKNRHQEILESIVGVSNITNTRFITLEEYGYKVINNTANKRAANQQKDKISKFENLILPHFRGFFMQDIKTTDIEFWQNKLLEIYSTSTVKKCKDILNLIFKKALADDVVIKNYASLADNVAVKSHKKTPYKKEELISLLQNSTEWFHIFLLLVTSSGIRPGEAIGLKWEDINFVKSSILLKRSISKGKIVDETSTTNFTKNHSRVVPLDNTVLVQLDLFKKEQKAKAENWIFTNKRGNHFYDAANIKKLYWNPLLESLNIVDKGMYTLRHTFVSIMKNNGASDMWLKSVVGHSQNSIVLDSSYFTFDDSDNNMKGSNNFFEHLNGDKKNG